MNIYLKIITFIKYYFYANVECFLFRIFHNFVYIQFPNYQWDHCHWEQEIVGWVCRIIIEPHKCSQGKFSTARKTYSILFLFCISSRQKNKTVDLTESQHIPSRHNFIDHFCKRSMITRIRHVCLKAIFHAYIYGLGKLNQRYCWQLEEYN